MPSYRAHYPTRAAAEDAATVALEQIVADYTAASENDALVAAGEAPATAAPTCRFTVTAVEALPVGALPAGATAMWRTTWLVETPDGQNVTTTIGTDQKAVGYVEYHSIGAPLEWRTRVTPEVDGRWLAELYSLPAGG